MFHKFILTLAIFFLYSTQIYALETSKIDIFLQRNFEKIEVQLLDETHYRKIYIYSRLKNKIENYLANNTLIQDREYLLRESIFAIDTRISRLEKLIKLSESFESHDALILSFSNWNIDTRIENNKENITKAKSIFIFRDSTNLSLASMKSITWKIQELNPSTIIFIDQEGWQINRYKDFDSSYSRKNLLDHDFIQLRKQKLTTSEYNLFLTLFPVWAAYFPSLLTVGQLYDSYGENSTQLMLEMFAYMRLQSHADTGINTYGLVADLSRWNPSITPLQRSFSRHSDKYKLFLDAFALACRETWVLVYLKHFPGVGLWSVDSHNGILDLQNSEEALRENMELFAHAQKSFWSLPLGGMIGHVLAPETLKEEFNTTANNFDYIITDDLGMKWYTQATWKNFSNAFFSTDEIIENPSVIRLDRKNSFYIK